jgi:hypothetical protein
MTTEHREHRTTVTTERIDPYAILGLARDAIQVDDQFSDAVGTDRRLR